MTIRDAQGLAIAILCTATVYFSLVNSRGIGSAPWLKTLQYIQVFVVGYIGLLYFLSSIRALFGIDTGLTMDYYRSGILLLVITIFAEKLWRYRAGGR